MKLLLLFSGVKTRMSYFKKFYDEWHVQAGVNRESEVRDRDLMVLEYLKGAPSLIELGCGSGTILSMSDSPIRAGVDISEVAIRAAAANKNNPKDEFRAVNIDSEDLPFADNSFSAAMSIEVLEHLFDPVHALFELNRVLEKGGKLSVTVPNIGYYVYRLYHLFTGEVSDFHGNGLIVNEHIRYYSGKSLVHLIKLAGFEVVRIRGCMKNKVMKNNGTYTQKRSLIKTMVNVFNPSPIRVISKANKLFRLWDKIPSLFAVGLVVEARKTGLAQFQYNQAADHQGRNAFQNALNISSV